VNSSQPLCHDACHATAEVRKLLQMAQLHGSHDPDYATARPPRIGPLTGHIRKRVRAFCGPTGRTRNRSGEANLVIARNR
jgi:hypothetical protein